MLWAHSYTPFRVQKMSNKSNAGVQDVLQGGVQTGFFSPEEYLSEAGDLSQFVHIFAHALIFA
jgi:hypothetical protein